MDELWPVALAELGVQVPVTSARAAMACWLVRALWPGADQGDDPQLDALVLTIHDRIGCSSPDSRGADPAARARADSARRTLHAAVEAMAQDDLIGAARALDGGDG